MVAAIGAAARAPPLVSVEHRILARGQGRGRCLPSAAALLCWIHQTDPNRVLCAVVLMPSMMKTLLVLAALVACSEAFGGGGKAAPKKGRRVGGSSIVQGDFSVLDVVVSIFHRSSKKNRHTRAGFRLILYRVHPIHVLVDFSGTFSLFYFCYVLP